MLHCLATTLPKEQHFPRAITAFHLLPTVFPFRSGQHPQSAKLRTDWGRTLLQPAGQLHPHREKKSQPKLQLPSLLTSYSFALTYAHLTHTEQQASHRTNAGETLEGIWRQQNNLEPHSGKKTLKCCDWILCCNRLPREGVEIPSMEIFQNLLNITLCHVVWNDPA